MLRSRHTRRIVACAAAAACVPSIAAAQCDGVWRSVAPRADLYRSGIDAFLQYDDGRGPALFAFGYIQMAGGVDVNSIARWDGSAWSDLDGGVSYPAADGSVADALVFNDGAQDLLVVGGSFRLAGAVPAVGVAAYDAEGWRPLGDGLQNPVESSYVNALAVYDDGRGPTLYAAGEFELSGSTTVNNIAWWDGLAWQPVEFFATGLDGVVHDMAVYDDGAGPKLVVAGEITSVGGMPVNNIAAWDGSAWSRLGEGLDRVIGVEVFKGELYAMGPSGSGGTSLLGFGRWDGATWRTVGDAEARTLGAMYVHDDGSGSKLYVGADLRDDTGAELSIPAVWDGAAWASLPESTSPRKDPITAMTVHDDGRGERLWVAGGFDSAGAFKATTVALFDGMRFTPLGGDFNGEVLDIAYQREGSEDVVYVAGRFTFGAGAAAYHVIRNRAGTWEPVGDGFDMPVFALASYDDGGGPAIYAGGDFLKSGDGDVTGVGKWNGSAWEPVGGGVPGGEHQGVRDLAVHDDGAGPALYATGFFTQAGGVFVNRVARWDGSTWSPLGRGLDNVGFALTSHDDGAGPKLYVGGEFVRAGGLAGVDANHIACWDGAAWSALGGGANDRVFSLGSFQDAGGRHLLAGGEFTVIGGKALKGAARWDGSAWHDLGGGLVTGPFKSGAAAFQPLEIDGKAMVAVGGSFDQAGTVAANSIALWSSTEGWRALGDGVRRDMETGLVSAIELVDSGPEPVLWAGGFFSLAGGVGSSNVAEWTHACDCVADCDGNGVLDFFDFLCFQNLFGAGDLRADCDGNGILDFFDFLCFQNEFAKGCP